jgi:U3 small nucleolar RNA-associated protein 22
VHGAEVLAKRGSERVVKDLLVGFDPVSIYLDFLAQPFGDLATYCADSLGGPVIGLKWHSQVCTTFHL